MKNQFPKRSLSFNLILCLTGMLIVSLGLAFFAPAQPAQASPPAQNATTTPTVTGAATGMVTMTVSVTTTPTTVGTLPAPAVTGTPTALIPVTGADLTQPGSGGNIGLWIALWLVGLLLIGFGVVSRLNSRER